MSNLKKKILASLIEGEKKMGRKRDHIILILIFALGLLALWLTSKGPILP